MSIFFSFSPFIIDGKNVGAIFFTGRYKIDSSKVSFLIKEIVSFIFPKKIKTTLNINPIFKNPNNPPSNLFITPKEAKLAILVNTFPKRAMATIISTKVIAKAANDTYSVFQVTYSLKKFELRCEKWIAPYTPPTNAAREATSTNKPFIKPLTNPKSKKEAIIISKIFIKLIFSNLHIFFHNFKLSIVSLQDVKIESMQKINTLKEKWDVLVAKLTHQFADGDKLSMDGIIYLIGVQELGQSHREYKKEEKLNLMHIAICKLLEPYGYYEFDYFDTDHWPHYKTLTALPNLKPGEQTVLMKEAIVNYFDEIDYFKN